MGALCIVCFHFHWGEINERGKFVWAFGLCYLSLETLAKLAPLNLDQCILRALSLLKSPFGIKELVPFPFLVFVVALSTKLQVHTHIQTICFDRSPKSGGKGLENWCAALVRGLCFWQMRFQCLIAMVVSSTLVCTRQGEVRFLQSNESTGIAAWFVRVIHAASSHKCPSHVRSCGERAWRSHS